MRRVLHTAGGVLSWLLLVVVVAGVVLLLIPSLLGYKLYAITSGSMTGTIDRGSLVYDKPVPVSSLQVGDIITYQPPPSTGVHELITHRLIMVSTTKSGERVFRTKGDANPVADPWTFTLIRATQPRYRFHIPYLGYLEIVIGSPRNRFVLILLVGGAILVALIVELVRMGRGRRPSPQVVASN